MERALPVHKAVLLGDANVGKTSLLRRYVEGAWSDGYEATTNLSAERLHPSQHRQACEIDAWDTAGQERYHAIVPYVMRGAAAALVVFDLSSAPSLASARALWLPFAREHAGAPGVALLLFGNKADLPRAVAASAAAECCADGVAYVEGSAKTGEGVAEAFAKLAELCVAASAPRAPAEAPAARGRGCC
jgi:Ras-related protein Rab-5C